MSLGWDAFGRLALGQIGQNYAATAVHLSGVSGSGANGKITANPGGNPAGVAGTSGVGGFAGGTTTTAGTPIGALLTLTIGTTVSAGNGDKVVAKTETGVAGTGSPGTALANPGAQLGGVSGAGAAGTMAPYGSLTGRSATGTTGTIVAQVSGFTLTGVEGDTALGTLLGEPGFQALQGVEGDGFAGTITIVVSGGGGKKRTGFDEIKKVRPTPPAPIRLPTYAIPNFRLRPAPPVVPDKPTTFDRPKGVAPLDFNKMGADIREAQDQADIKAVMEFLDTVD